MTLLSSTKSGLEIGTIIDAVGPPDYRWAICDGSILEQSAYSSYVNKVVDIHPQCWTYAEAIAPPAFALNRTGIAKKGNTIVVMPYSDNDVFYSTDNGANWQTASNALPSSGSWNRVTSNDTYFVALRSDSNAGAYSSDGISWTGFTMPVSGDWYYILWNGTVFIAGPSTSNATIYYSSNGYTWSAGATFGTGIYPYCHSKNCDDSGYFLFYDGERIRRTNNGTSLSNPTDPFYFNENNSGPTAFFYFNGLWWAMDDNSFPVWWVSDDSGDTWTSRQMNNNDAYDDYFYPDLGSFDSGEELVFLCSNSGPNWVSRDGYSFSPRVNMFSIPQNSVFVSKSGGAFVLANSSLSAGDINAVRVFKLNYTPYDYTTHFQLPLLRGTHPGMFKYIKVK